MLGSKQLMYPKSLLICEGGHEFSCFNIKINEINAFISKYTANIIRNIEKQKKNDDTIFIIAVPVQFSSVHFTRSVMSDSLRTHEVQHARPPCPSPSGGVHSDSRSLSQWCHPAISSLVVPFSPAHNPSQHQSLFQ